ncbi:hypothetical protein PInf_002173 [Phytophthora infestans]|nr:hypothetical protein PInf_002173 [Phytophthora infestans]
MNEWPPSASSWFVNVKNGPCMGAGAGHGCGLLCQAGVFLLPGVALPAAAPRHTGRYAYRLGRDRRAFVRQAAAFIRREAMGGLAGACGREGSSRRTQTRVALVLGDQFDEGSRWTPNADWDEYADRFFRAFASLLPLKTLYLVGNHDTSFGRDMRLQDVKRYEVTFGAANRIDEIEGHTFVSLNTMALDSDVASHDELPGKRHFDDLRARTRGSVILLTHLPLFRVDDLQCGEERLREAGHVTYEAPGFKYETHHHVLSRELSAKLLDKIQPDLVLSGHTTRASRPSYAVLGLSRANRPEVTACYLPQEPFIFATYAATASIVVLAHLVRLVQRLRKFKAEKTKDA